MNARRHRVLVIDDSAFARKVLREVLSADERLEVVGFARDGLDALEKISELKPDVITLDLMMPELDGVGVLHALAAQPNPPRVILVTTTDAENALAVEALTVGAFDVVYKPTAQATDRLYELENELVEKVVLAARSPKPGRYAPLPSPSPRVEPRPDSSRDHSGTKIRLVVIGASTGGPSALTGVLGALPADFPVPVAVVCHMPVGYTEAFAARLDVSSHLRVSEAAHGAPLERGAIVIGRAGTHLRLRQSGGVLTTLLEGRSTDDSLHCPSVDVLFESAASQLGGSVLGVVLTGMGSDGLAGSRAIHEAGGHLIAEAESSCVVYGMPRAVAEAHIGADEVPLHLVAQAIIRRFGPLRSS